MAVNRLGSIEATKMKTAVYSPRDARVADVLVSPNWIVTAKDLFVALEQLTIHLVLRNE